MKKKTEQNLEHLFTFVQFLTALNEVFDVLIKIELLKVDQSEVQIRSRLKYVRISRKWNVPVILHHKSIIYTNIDNQE